MSILILDTCEIHKNFHFNGAILAALTSFCTEFGITLVLPEVVVEEHVADYREALEEDASAAKRYFRVLNIGDDNPTDFPEVEQAVDKYRAFVREWVGKFGGVAPIPEGRSTEILQKLLRKRKPFKADRTGYADSLIWMTVMSCAKEEEEEVLFVSSNVNDFGQNAGLHPDLLQELDQQGIDRSTVKYFGGSKLFEKEYIRPAREQAARRKQLDTLAELLLSGDWQPLSLQDWIEKNFDSLDPSSYFTGWDIGVPYEFDDAEYAEFDSFRYLDSVEVSDAGGGLLLVQIVASIAVQYHANADVEDLDDGYGGTTAEIVGDEDYNFFSHSYRADILASLDCQVKIAMRVNEATGAVQDPELSGMYKDGKFS